MVENIIPFTPTIQPVLNLPIVAEKKAEVIQPGIKLLRSTRHDVENVLGKTPQWFFATYCTLFGCPRVVAKLDGQSHQSQVWATRSLRNYCSSTQKGYWRAATVNVDELYGDGEWSTCKFHNEPHKGGAPCWISVSIEIKPKKDEDVVRIYGNIDYYNYSAANAMFELVNELFKGSFQFFMEFSKNDFKQKD